MWCEVVTNGFRVIIQREDFFLETMTKYVKIAKTSLWNVFNDEKRCLSCNMQFCMAYKNLAGGALGPQSQARRRHVWTWQTWEVVITVHFSSHPRRAKLVVGVAMLVCHHWHFVGPVHLFHKVSFSECIRGKHLCHITKDAWHWMRHLRRVVAPLHVINNKLPAVRQDLLSCVTSQSVQQD